jgi:hypothetical protein
LEEDVYVTSVNVNVGDDSMEFSTGKGDGVVGVEEEGGSESPLTAECITTACDGGYCCTEDFGFDF